jgi:uncharacterized protein YdeI (YjbR/CyaY-like superfamily)
MWPESVDEALCFGWIDGIRKSIDDKSYMIRFTPRKQGSKWSEVNLKRAEELKGLGRMAPAGLEAFGRWDSSKSGRYSYEQQPRELDEEYARIFKKNAAAWGYFQSQPPGYRRLTAHFVMSAKKEETRLRRLARLIDDSSHGRRIGLLARPDAKR